MPRQAPANAALSHSRFWRHRWHCRNVQGHLKFTEQTDLRIIATSKPTFRLQRPARFHVSAVLSHVPPNHFLHLNSHFPLSTMSLDGTAASSTDRRQISDAGLSHIQFCRLPVALSKGARPATNKNHMTVLPCTIHVSAPPCTSSY